LRIIGSGAVAGVLAGSGKQLQAMSEQEVFWVGRRPAGEAPALPTADPAFETGLRALSEAAGCPVQRFVAARGEFGSWLLDILHSGQPCRLIWNGQAGRLSLDVPNPAGGWDERRAVAMAAPTPDALFAEIRALLAGP
jgi:hypothetical protein